MRRTLLNGKIHRATVTGAELHYPGSITIDAELMAAAGLVDWERVLVVDVTNGARLETYAIPGGGPGVVEMNGAAAHLMHVGDTVIIMSFVDVDDAEARGWRPTIVLVDESNRITAVRNGREADPVPAAAVAE